MQNCWKAKNCGREPDGARVAELGVCPAAVADECDGINGGKQGGRICWAVAGTVCGGQVRGTFAQKGFACMQCDFFREVKDEMGPSFQLVPNPLLMEKALRAAEERCRSIFDGAPIGLYRSTPNGELVDVNLTLVQMLGFPDREAVLGVTMDAVDAEARDRRAETLRRDGQLRDFELRLRRRDGTVFWAQERSHLVFDETGHPLYEEGSIQDITERQEALVESRAREAAEVATRALFGQFHEIASIMAAVNAIVYVADLDTCELLYVNPYTESLFGDDAVGKPCYRVLQTGYDGPCPFCTNDRLVIDGKAGPPVISELKNTVTGRWYLCIDKAIPWANGRLVRMETAIGTRSRDERRGKRRNLNRKTGRQEEFRIDYSSLSFPSSCLPVNLSRNLPY